MFKSIAQIAGAIMLAAWAAIGETQNILGVFNNSPNIVRWTPLIALILLLLLTGWAWFDMRKRIKELEDKMPKVTLLNSPNAEWFYDWNYLTHNLDSYVKDKIQVNGIRVLMHTSVINKGWESTKLLASFKSEDGKNYNLFGEQSVPLEGRGTILNTEFVFNFPTKSDFPKRGTKIKGLLTIEAWGDKTLTQEIICEDTNRADLVDEVIQQIERAVK